MPLVKGGRLATRSNVSAVQSRHHRSDIGLTVHAAENNDALPMGNDTV